MKWFGGHEAPIVKAFATVGDVDFPMVKIAVEDMNAILASQREGVEIEGVPFYFDDNGRVFPKKSVGVTVEFIAGGELS